MNLKIIAFLMTAILAILFIWTYFYAPKARKRSELEAKFYEELLKLKKAGISEPTEDLKQLAQRFADVSGQDINHLLGQIK